MEEGVISVFLPQKLGKKLRKRAEGMGYLPDELAVELLRERLNEELDPEDLVNYHLPKQVAFSLRCAFTAHFAVFACAPRACLGSCERPQQSAHTEPLSSPSERHSHNEDMRPVDRDPCDKIFLININIHNSPAEACGTLAEG